MKVVKKSHYYDSEIGETIVLAIFRPSEEEKDIRGASRPNNDGSYTIFLNEQLSSEQFDKAFRHERDHIIRGDFDVDKRWDSVQDIETIAHGNIVSHRSSSEASERVIRHMKRSIAKMKKELAKKQKEIELLEKLGVYMELREVEDEFGVPVMKWVKR